MTVALSQEASEMRRTYFLLLLARGFIESIRWIAELNVNETIIPSGTYVLNQKGSFEITENTTLITRPILMPSVRNRFWCRSFVCKRW